MPTKKIAILKYATSAFITGAFLLGFAACSSDSSVAGNSAEIGNPELAISGQITYSDGKPAAMSRVRCVPVDFNAQKDRLPTRWITVTDDSGHYKIDSLPAAFSIEANNDSKRVLLLEKGLTDKDSLYSGVLQAPGTIVLPISGKKDGDTVTVAIPGTSFLQKDIVKNGAITIDSLPATLIQEIIVDDSPVKFKEPLQILSDSTISLVPEQEPYKPLSLQRKFVFNGMKIPARTLNIPLALRLNGNELEFDEISKVKGTWKATRKESELKLEIASFDTIRKQAVFWVLMDTLCADGKDTLTLSFNEGEVNFNEGVFGKSYISAWHFDEGTQKVADAAKNIEGTPYDVKDTVGAIGKAFYYDGRTAHVRFDNSNDSPLNFAESDTMSISLWTQLEIDNSSRYIFNKGQTQFDLLYFDSKKCWLFERYTKKTETIEDDDDVFNNSWRKWFISEENSAVPGEWTMLTITQVDTNFSFYMNGQLVADTAMVGWEEKAVDETRDFVIGHMEIEDDKTNYRYKGIIDEMLVQNVAMDSTRIKIMYQNQKPTDYWPKLAQ